MLRDPETCPFLLEKIIHNGKPWGLSCRVIAEGLGFPISIEVDTCAECVQYESEQNPVTKQLIVRAFLARVYAGDSARFCICTMMTADAAIVKAKACGATDTECVKALWEAVCAGFLTTERALEIRKGSGVSFEPCA